MNNIKQEKGFTLIELLVAVVILGIITGMSIPLIKNIQLRNEDRKYKSYGETLITAAKLYRDSYEEDLFGRKQSGCALIPLSKLIERNLIKDFSDNNISCNYPQTMVRIVKIDKQYAYSYNLACGPDFDHLHYNHFSLSDREKKLKGDTSSEEEANEENYGTFGGFDLSSCNTKGSMNILANPVNGIDKAETYHVKIVISSSTGINITKPINIMYAWVEAPEADETVDNTPIPDDSGEENNEIETVEVEDIDIDYNAISNWEKLTFYKIDDIETQKNKLTNSVVETITATSRAISPPNNEANKWYLVLKVNNLTDLGGETYPNEYEQFGIYNIAKRYTLTYDDNGGSGCASTNKEYLLGKNENDTWGNLCEPTRDNYYFNGWNTKADGTGENINEDTPITTDLKVYAKWQKAKVIIYYKLMSNDILTASTTSTPNDAGVTTTYKWRKGSGDLVERSVNNGASYIVISSSIVAGTNRTLDLANYNNSHYLKITNPNYTRAVSGKEWICESGCKKAGQTFSHNKITDINTDNICNTTDGDCKIYIRVNWDTSSLTSCQYTLDQQGGSGGTSAIFGKDKKWYSISNPTSSTTPITSITKPTKTGNTFGGYYPSTGGSGTQVITATGAITATAPQCNTVSTETYFAKWTLNTCTIKFSPNGGVFNNNADNTTKTIKYGEKVDNFWNANGGTYNATRTGYTITSSKAWLLSGTTKTFDETKGYKATDVCTSLKTKNQTVTLKANWQAKKLKVTFNCNGGTGGGTQTFTYGVSGQKFSQTCTKKGYKLLGWAETSTATTNKWSINSNVTDNWINTNYPKKTVYAVWRTTHLYIYLNGNKDSSMGTSSNTHYSLDSSKNVLYDKKEKAKHTIYYGGSIGTNGLVNYNNTGGLNIVKSGNAAKKGQEWNTKADGTGISFNQDKNYTANDFCNIDNNDCELTLYVNWTNKPYYNTDNQYFSTLQDALNSTATGKTIYLLRNYSDSAGATLSTNKLLTFDANGHTLNLTGNSIEVTRGNLTFINGTIITAKKESRAIYANGGAVIIDGTNKAITIKSTHVTDTIYTEEAIRINNHGKVTVRGANAKVQAGSGTSSGYARIVSIEGTGGTFKMTGGTLVGDATKSGYGGATGVNAEYNGIIEISGGTIHITNLSASNQCVLCANDNSSVKVTGGTIQVDKSNGRGMVFFNDDDNNGKSCYNSGSVTVKKPSNLALTGGKVSSSCS